MFLPQTPNVPIDPASGLPAADPHPASEALGWFESIGWVDRSALAVLLVFFVLGLFRGAGWQMSRIAILLIAYAAALFGGPPLTAATRHLYGDDVDRALPQYVAGTLVFLAALALCALLAWQLTRRREREPLGFGSRLSGAGLGLVTGGLVILGVLTATHVFAATTSLGTRVVHAAEHSATRAASERVVRMTERVMPIRFESGAQAWQHLFEAPLAERPARASQPSAPADAGAHAFTTDPQPGVQPPAQPPRDEQKLLPIDK